MILTKVTVQKLVPKGWIRSVIVINLLIDIKGSIFLTFSSNFVTDYGVLIIDYLDSKFMSVRSRVR